MTAKTSSIGTKNNKGNKNKKIDLNNIISKNNTGYIQNTIPNTLTNF